MAVGEASRDVTFTPMTCIDGRMTENMSAQHDTVEHTSENGRSSILKDRCRLRIDVEVGWARKEGVIRWGCCVDVYKCVCVRLSVCVCM